MERVHTHVPASTIPAHPGTDTHTFHSHHHPLTGTRLSTAVPQAHTVTPCVPQHTEQLLPDAENASAGFPLQSFFPFSFAFLAISQEGDTPGERISCLTCCCVPLALLGGC